ncbi:unnamed protein product, partial [Allacma fusca]
VPCPR